MTVKLWCSTSAIAM